ncbi:DUF998 domain-containing protein [Natronorubrum sulfidifaciens]|uniref:DUF998 domain-containing protein n=1 Tax=Natronorubrum sulfidifaciens JCM 14089 TaxID=1230460 RepID=L9W672_9EURY|nr:DUF998 domain-containing protein [Natronorubrum sulfidifaciens]ELY43833.1 hypothetical protein C495_12250 [Natronorubrum sulfidifaciens JCM 14089]
MANRNWRRLATGCGLAAPAIALGAIVLATLLAAPETFTWRDRALSDMGRYGTRTFLLFNGGLIVGGLLGVPFGWRLWIASHTLLERVGVGLLWVATIGLVGVGVFFLDHTEFYLATSLHGPAALLFFGLAPFAQWLYGSGLVLAEAPRLGLASIWLGLLHPIGWLGWLLYRIGSDDPMAWFAVPEFVAAVAFGGWVLLVAGTQWRQETGRSTVSSR